MVILLPYLESGRLNNGSVITLKQSPLSCSVNAPQHTGQGLEENQGVVGSSPTPLTSFDEPPQKRGILKNQPNL